MCEYETVLCFDHKPVQHRDAKPPWCNDCGWDAKIATKFGRGKTTTDAQTYQTRSTQIQAVKYVDKNYLVMNRFVGKIFEDDDGDMQWGFIPLIGGDGHKYTAMVYDELHDTWVRVKDGDMIIKGTKGEFYPCDAEVFAEKYEPVSPTTP